MPISFTRGYGVLPSNQPKLHLIQSVTSWAILTDMGMRGWTCTPEQACTAAPILAKESICRHSLCRSWRCFSNTGKRTPLTGICCVSTKGLCRDSYLSSAVLAKPDPVMVMRDRWDFRAGQLQSVWFTPSEMTIACLP